MIGVMLATALGLAGEPGATTVAPLTVSPAARPAATIDVPNDDTAKGQWASVWPQAAYRDGVAGRVLLNCEIDRYGLAERCAVASETPPNQGFGAAALQLRPTFKLRPAMGPRGPIDAAMTIAVDFKPPSSRGVWGGAQGAGLNASSVGPLSSGGGADGPSFSGPPTMRDHRPVSILNNPVWASAPGWRDLLGAYPAGGGGGGYAVAHCRVRRGGAVSDCDVVKEEPENRGFGRAAMALAQRFRVAAEWSVAPHHADLYVDIPVRFPARGETGDRMVDRPYWVAGVDRNRAVKIFPAAAAEKGLVTGLGVAECRVARDGSLSGCTPGAADPDGFGFSEAAVELAPAMRMNPWLRDGQPADGSGVRVAVRLNLKPAQ